jgi:hypothetical protein
LQFCGFDYTGFRPSYRSTSGHETTKRFTTRHRHSERLKCYVSGGDWERGVVLRGGARVYLEALSLANTVRIYFIGKALNSERWKTLCQPHLRRIRKAVVRLQNESCQRSNKARLANCPSPKRGKADLHQSPPNSITTLRCSSDWLKGTGRSETPPPVEQKTLPNEKNWKLNGCAFEVQSIQHELVH